MNRFFSLLFAVPALLAPSFAGSVRIYQTNSAGDHVDIIDPVTNTVVMKVEGIEVPHGVVGSPDGNALTSLVNPRVRYGRPTPRPES